MKGDKPGTVSRFPAGRPRQPGSRGAAESPRIKGVGGERGRGRPALTWGGGPGRRRGLRGFPPAGRGARGAQVCGGGGEDAPARLTSGLPRRPGGFQPQRRPGRGHMRTEQLRRWPGPAEQDSEGQGRRQPWSRQRQPRRPGVWSPGARCLVPGRLATPGVRAGWQVGGFLCPGDARCWAEVLAHLSCCCPPPWPQLPFYSSGCRSPAGAWRGGRGMLGSHGSRKPRPPWVTGEAAAVRCCETGRYRRAPGLWLGPIQGPLERPGQPLGSPVLTPAGTFCKGEAGSPWFEDCEGFKGRTRALRVCVRIRVHTYVLPSTCSARGLPSARVSGRCLLS
nr:collagen alpha-1(XVI) chain isoform X2 [Oryctolagus cuniculus]